MQLCNRKNLTKFLSVTALGLGLAFSPFPAQAETNYKWQTFENVDVDRSGFLEGGEYTSYAFGMADWDNDGYLEQTEWVSYKDKFYDDYDLDKDAFTYIDSDGDGFVDYTEYNEYAVNEDLYSYWDYDDDDVIGDKDWDQVTVYYKDKK